jgi:hypothetical protein
VRANMVFTFVATMDEVLRLALLARPTLVVADKPPADIQPETAKRPALADGPVADVESATSAVR